MISSRASSFRTFGPRLAAGCLVASATVAASAGGPAWQSAGTLPGAKAHAFGATVNGVVYAIGGTPWANGGDQDGSVFRQNGGSWIAAPALDGMGPIVPQGGGVDDLGRVIVFGGLVSDNGDVAPNVVYDLVDGPQGEIADPGDLVAHEGFACAIDESRRLYWLGGGGGAAGGNTGHAERYVGSADAWTAIAPLPVPVGDACACSDGLGHILVFGGFVANGSARTAEVQRFDVASGAWSIVAVPDLPEAVSGARAVLGVDGRIYVIGGVGDDGTVRSAVLVLSLASNSWSTGPSLATARQRCAATLGADDRIHAIGGEDANGAALASVEAIFTPTCPSVLGSAPHLEPWTGETIVMPAAIGGSGPMTFAWLHDGAPLADGPTGTGSTIDGATTATLVVQNGGPDDEGVYEIVASNDCGTTQDVVATVAMRIPATIPTAWTVHVLHPSGSIASSGTALDGDAKGGTLSYSNPDHGTLTMPVLWNGGGAWENLTPANSVGGGVNAIEGDMAVGWWWWPYSCQSGGQWYTCYSRQAARWVGGAGGFDNLQASGWEYSAATVVFDGVVGGSATNDDASGNVWTHGGLWEPPGYWFRDLHPGAVASSSSVAALDAGGQYGTINTPYPGPTVHAARWSGTADSFVDMHPAGFGASRVSGAGDGQQVGSTGYYSDQRACMWSGTPESWRDLHPGGATRSWAVACVQGLQFGGAVLDGATRPLIWRGAADDFVDLSTMIPAGSGPITIEDAQMRADGTIEIIGSMYDLATLRNEAVLLVGATTVPGDLDGDGSVGLGDLLILLSSWGPCTPPCVADLDGDGTVGFADLLMLLALWS